MSVHHFLPSTVEVCKSVARSGLDVGLVASDVLLELEKLGSELDLLLQEVLGVQVVRGGVARVLLDVQTDGGAGGAGTRETDDDAASRGEAGIEALIG